MGFSIAVIAFALEDGPRVLDHMGWKVTDQLVGEPVDSDLPAVDVRKRNSE